MNPRQAPATSAMATIHITAMTIRSISQLPITPNPPILEATLTEPVRAAFVLSFKSEVWWGWLERICRLSGPCRICRIFETTPLSPFNGRSAGKGDAV